MSLYIVYTPTQFYLVQAPDAIEAVTGFDGYVECVAITHPDAFSIMYVRALAHCINNAPKVKAEYFEARVLLKEGYSLTDYFNAHSGMILHEIHTHKSVEIDPDLPDFPAP